MTTDTTPLVPTDAEIDSLWEGQKLTVPQLVQRRAIARAVLARWGGAPAAPHPVAREPLTDDRLRVIERMHVYAHTATLMDFARAIERAHGIKGGQHGTD